MQHNSCEREERNNERSKPADTKFSEGGRGGGVPGLGVEMPLQPVEKTMVKQVVPLEPMEVHSGADRHPATPGGPYARAVDVP